MQGFVLAIDGGQTATKSLIATTDGCIVGRGRGPATGNLLSQQGQERLFRSVRDAIQSAVTGAFGGGGDAPHFAALCCSMSGLASSTPDLPVFQKYVSSLVQVGAFRVEWDGITALAGASVCSTGVVVISGGGSVAFGVNAAGERVHVGGWGHSFGDAGSGFDIGRCAVRLAVRAADGMGPPTSLGQAICRHLDLPDLRAVKRQRDALVLDDSCVASLVAVVAREASEGDAVARQLLAEAGSEMALLAATAVRRLGAGEPANVYPTGGVFEGVPLVRESFAREVPRLAPAATVRRAAYSPLVGALLLALQDAGCDITPGVTAAIDASG